jgi:RNA polymerase sigma-70 factor (ECF subfamily)
VNLFLSSSVYIIKKSVNLCFSNLENLMEERALADEERSGAPIYNKGMDPEESELVSRLKKGDEKAFAQLYQDHHLQVFRTSYLILGSKEQAEDIMQETFFKLWQNRAKIREGNVLPWLLRVATNASLSLWRKKREFPLEEAPLLKSRELDPEEAATYREILEELNKLPKRQRAVLTLRLLWDYSEEETAKILGVPPGTVRSNLFKARENLRKKIDGR